MDNPLVRKDLVESIVELRAEVERRLRQNQYYVAMHKLDELLAAIRPLDIIEGEANPPAPAAEAAPAEVSAEPETEETPEAPASRQPPSRAYGTEVQAGLSAAPTEQASDGLDPESGLGAA
jgi:hypothetical protein